MWANNQVNTSLSGQTGTDAFVGSNTPTITTPQIVTAIEDVNGNDIIGLSANASAVNYLLVNNAITGGAPGISAVGSDTDVNLTISSKRAGGIYFYGYGFAVSALTILPVASAANYIQIINAITGNPPEINAQGLDSDITLSINGKGTGGIQTLGSTAGSFVPAGYVGEIISSTILYGSAVSCGATGVATDMTSIELTAGNWTIEGNVYFDISTVSGNSLGSCWISTTSATAPDNAYITTAYGVGGYNNIGNGAATTFLSITTTTQVYISGACTYASGSPTMCGGIYATRLP